MVVQYVAHIHNREDTHSHSVCHRCRTICHIYMTPLRMHTYYIYKKKKRRKICSENFIVVFALGIVCVYVTFRTHFIMNGESAHTHTQTHIYTRSNTKQITVIHNLYLLSCIIYHACWHRHKIFSLKHLFHNFFS